MKCLKRKGINLLVSSKVLILSGFVLLSGGIARCQDTTSAKTPQWELGFEGMIGTSVGENFIAFNVGGPAFQLVLTKDFKIGVGAFPSFYVLNGKTGARLGVSPRIDYKKLVFIAPFYHRDSADEWIWSVGLGYKFHKKH